jgi:membrane associated rhomboid family serine protease
MLNYLIGVNIGVYLGWKSGIISKQLLVEKLTIHEGNKWKLYPLVSYSFSHNELLQLVCNMCGLVMFGRQVELIQGPYRLL